MTRYELQNGIQGADSNWVVIWNGDVKLASELGSQANVGTILANPLVDHATERLDQSPSGDVPWRFHAAMTSSRTK